MTIKDIQRQADPLRKAAMLHVRFWQTAAWEKARAMRDDLIDEHDPEWPHGRFWDIVDAICGPDNSLRVFVAVPPRPRRWNGSAPP